jgi:hypothetical protein
VINYISSGFEPASGVNQALADSSELIDRAQEVTLHTRRILEESRELITKSRELLLKKVFVAVFNLFPAFSTAEFIRSLAL